MNGLEVLDAAEPAERRAWLARWEASAEREPFAHPDHALAFAAPGQRAIALAWEDAGGEALLPLHVRPLAGEAWIGAGGEGDRDPVRDHTRRRDRHPDVHALVDLATPYGYGGPFALGRPDAEAFWGAVRAWAREARAVSLFVRRALFPEELVQLPAGAEVHAADNVVRSLDLPAEAIWRDHDAKVRKNVNKARRAGLTVEVDAAAGDLEPFLRVYHATMDRRGASAFYRFDRAMLLSLLDGPAGRRAVLFHVRDASGAVVSSELVLASATRLFSFLGGTLPEALPQGANDLLKHAVIGWGREHGKRAFVLGGGLRPGDGIFRYKRAFAPAGVVPFHVGRVVLDPAACEALLARRRAHEAARGNPRFEPDPGFFPPYRAPAAPSAG